MKNKSLAIVFFICLLSFTYTSVSFADNYEEWVLRYYPEDLNSNHWAYDELDLILSSDIISGSKDSRGLIYIKPEEKVTRAQFAKMIVNALDLSPTTEPAKTFPDVLSSDWFYPYVNTASQHGIITGLDNGTFNPNAPITRDQLTIMIMRAFKLKLHTEEGISSDFIDVPNDNWAYEDITKAYSLGIITGYGDEFKPRNTATRAQSAVMLTRAMFQEANALPTEQEIVEPVTKFFNTQLQYFLKGDLGDAYDAYIDNTSGFYMAHSYYWFRFWDEQHKNGSYVRFTTDYNLSVQPLVLSDRFAIVEVTGVQYSMSIHGQGTTHFKEDGYYYLKKNRNGEWRIFNSYTFNQ